MLSYDTTFGDEDGILSEATYRVIAETSEIPSLEKSNIRLKTYTGEAIKVLGATTVNARYANQEATLSIQVVEGAGPDLMGRDWLAKFEVTLGEVNHLEETTQPQALQVKDPEVFDGNLGCLRDVQVTLHVKPDAKLKFFKPRSVPHSLKQKVEDELEKMLSLGIISAVRTSKWAAPIVPALKKDCSVRICGDFKPTYNQAADTETYPIPRVEELFSNLSGGKQFTKLDMSSAYLQLPIDDASKEYTTINTHKGLFQFNRLPFGIASAPAIFQRTMETLLRGIPGISVYLEDHLQSLQQVLEHLSKAGFRLSKAKCFFLRNRIEYLGHLIDDHGLHPTDEKINAIKNAPRPRDVTELRSFLGILNYYGKFLPGSSSTLAPLHSLLRKNIRWSWRKPQEDAFTLAKNALHDDTLLVHFDPKKPLIVACDASQYGLGAVLSHLMDDGQERPIAFASRTLSPAEKKYAQLEKEALAIIFAVTKFHHYLYGVHFTIQSDHQPLSFLFSELRGIPVMASSRIQRWALTLSAYHYIPPPDPPPALPRPARA